MREYTSRQVASKKVENLITRPFSSIHSVSLCADKEIPSLDYVYHDMGLREFLVREYKETTGENVTGEKKELGTRSIKKIVAPVERA